MNFEHSRQRFVLASKQLGDWIRHHLKASAISLVASMLGLPAVLLLSGAQFKEQLGEIIGYGIVGPAALVVIAFAYAWMRAAGILYDLRTSELRALRKQLGLPTDDIDPPTTTPARGSRREFIILTALWILLITGLSYEVYDIWQEAQQYKKIQATLGASSRKPKDLQRAAEQLRHQLGSAKREVDTQRGLANQRWHEIHDKDGYLDQIARLQANVNQPPAKENISPAKPSAPRLKRLIAYDNPTAIQATQTSNGVQIFLFQGFAFRINNASDDTLNIKMNFVRASLDGEKIMDGCNTTWSVVAQTQGISPQCRITPDGVRLQATSKTIILEFEIAYDTIPVTGVRQSYRRFIYGVDWANGTASAPFLTLQRIESEKED